GALPSLGLVRWSEGESSVSPLFVFDRYIPVSISSGASARCVGDHRLHVLGLGEVGAGGLVGGQLAAFPQADFQRPGRRVDQQIGRVDAALMLLVARGEQDGTVLLERGLGL